MTKYLIAKYFKGYSQQRYLAHIKSYKLCKNMVSPENIQCPVCGYYCLGKGGKGCIDKPTLCGYKL